MEWGLLSHNGSLVNGSLPPPTACLKSAFSATRSVTLLSFSSRHTHTHGGITGEAGEAHHHTGPPSLPSQPCLSTQPPLSSWDHHSMECPPNKAFSFHLFLPPPHRGVCCLPPWLTVGSPPLNKAMAGYT